METSFLAHTTLVFIFAYWSHLPALVNSDKYEVNLYKHLLHADRYEPAIRPTPDHRLATNVTFGFLLHQVINVDEKNQQLTTSTWMNVNWKDDRLTWNHSEWGDVKILHMPHQKVWKPDIILTNNADPEYKEAAVSTDVFVLPDGNVTWLYFAIYQSSCQIRVRFYPFDDQECSMTFASWSHDGSDVNLLLNTEQGDLSSYVNSSEWALLDMKAHRRLLNFSRGSGQWPVITITIQLSRRPLFYVFNHILPCVLISIMSMLGFYIPAETGEKVTMCITTMLSMGVFLKTITESMPPTSEAVPLIGMYYGVSLFIVCAATVVNVVTLNVHNKGYRNNPDPLPAWARKYILGYIANLLCIKIYPSDTQMMQLAEKRRRLQNDDELLNELITSRTCAETFGTPVVIQTETHKQNSHRTSIAQPQPDTCAMHQQHCQSRIGMSTGDVTSSQMDCRMGKQDQLRNGDPVHTKSYAPPHRNRYSKRTFSTCSGNSTAPLSHNRLSRHKSQKSQGTPSIYDYDYELTSLRKLNSQASLLSGALSLMNAPLQCSKNANSQKSYFNSLTLDSNSMEPVKAMPRTRVGTFNDAIACDLVEIAETAAERQSASVDLSAPLETARYTNCAKRLAEHEHAKNAADNGNAYAHCHVPAAQTGLSHSPHDAVARILKREFEEKFYNVLKKVYQTLEQNELRMALQEERTRIMWEWKQLAIIVDRLLLLLFVIATGLTTFLILFEPVIFDSQLRDDDTVPPVI